MVLLGFITIILYGIATLLQMLRLMGKLQLNKYCFLALGYMALILHGFLLYRWIDTSYGQNLYSLNVISMIAWIVNILILLASIRIPVENLAVLTLPIALISIVAVLIFPASALIHAGTSTWQLVHILLSIVAFSVLMISGVQALALSVLQRRLRNHHMGGFIRMLPPLETMEVLLFQMIGLGFVLLSISLITGFIFAEEQSQALVLEKIGFSLFAWVIFAGLLWGRLHFGWRGRIAIRGTLIGVGLLLLAYFGTHFLLT